MLCAFFVAGITLLFPLLTRYITKTVLEGGLPNALEELYRVGALMLFLIVIHTLFNFYVDYYGHAMGAMMESDMRSELFDHYQKLSFRFYDDQRTGQLMSRITNDLLSLAEFYHHAPEDYLIYTVKFVGAFLVLININVPLTLAVFLFVPVLAVFSLYFTKRLNKAFRTSWERIADVNAQVEDSLAGIRVVKSFVNEEKEKEKFGYQNNLFLESRKSIYRNESFIWQGVDAMTKLITVTVVVYGGLNIVNARLDLADLITFLLYIGNFI
jgi:ATP-binding cassette subfamily B protein